MNISSLKTICRKVYLDNVTSYRQGNKTLYEDSRTKIVKEVPHVWPIGISDSQVYIVCPYCSNIHMHGLCDGMYGHVKAHCSDKEACAINGKGYCIERI